MGRGRDRLSVVRDSRLDLAVRVIGEGLGVRGMRCGIHLHRGRSRSLRQVRRCGDGSPHICGRQRATQQVDGRGDRHRAEVGHGGHQRIAAHLEIRRSPCATATATESGVGGRGHAPKVPIGAGPLRDHRLARSGCPPDGVVDVPGLDRQRPKAGRYGPVVIWASRRPGWWPQGTPHTSVLMPLACPKVWLSPEARRRRRRRRPRMASSRARAPQPQVCRRCSATGTAVVVVRRVGPGGIDRGGRGRAEPADIDSRWRWPGG